mmetsp:Transcript_6979/g.17189  ORF Transcript_6979/g.17189 Transcript_6979/m.17189 type:complete len:904 (+) Transcript_6979:102-2813(+)
MRCWVLCALGVLALDHSAREARGAPRRPGLTAVAHVLRRSTTLPPLPPVVQEKVQEAHDQAEDLPDRVDEIQDDAQKDLERYHDTFMPGWRPERRLAIWSAVGALVSCIWLAIYFRFIYRNDRSDSIARWTHLEGHPMPDAEPVSFTPDFMMVFDNPGEDHGDEETEVAQETMERLLLEHTDAESFLRLKALMKQEKTTKSAVRAAVIQDIHDFLPSCGFEVTTFASVDKARLHMAVAVQSEEVVDHYFQNRHLPCQIQKGLVEKMGIAQDPHEPASNPPWVRYDKTVPDRIKKDVQGVQSVADVYRMYKGTHPEGSIARSIDRTRIIFGELTRNFEVVGAKEEGVLLDWYPVHNRRRLHELKAMWATTAVMLDFSFRQPAHVIHHYYGARVAFIFVWAGYYCKALFALLIPSLVCLGLMVGSWYYKWEEKMVLEVLQLGFGVVVIIWGAVARNMFTQETNYFVQCWAVTDQDMLPQGGYRGQLLPSPLNGNETERQASPVRGTLSNYFSVLVTVFFCILVMVAIYAWMMVFHGRMNLVASIALAIQIKVFELIYRPVAMWLTNLENHKYQVDFVNALVWKTFAFQFINYYYAFFYLMIVQKYTEAGCPMVTGVGHDCIWALRKQVLSTVGVLAVCRIAEVFAYWMLVKVMLWLEDRSLWQKAEETRATSIPVRSYPEEQAKYAAFEDEEQIETMLQLVLSLGFVLLFACVAPMIVIVVFVVFVVQLRASSWFLTNAVKRNFPRQVSMNGIGAWAEVIGLVMVLGVFNSALVLVIHGEAFQGQHILTRITFLFLFVASSFLIWEILGRQQPQEDAETHLLRGRRQYVLRRLADLGVHKPQADSVRKSKRDEAEAKAITRGEWDAIPQLGRDSEAWNDFDNPDNQREHEPAQPLRSNDPTYIIP